jgi:hypothetical protein
LEKDEPVIFFEEISYNMANKVVICSDDYITRDIRVSELSIRLVNDKRVMQLIEQSSYAGSCRPDF